jgi:hypothetical protein
MGVDYVWVIDPESREAWAHSSVGPVHQVTDGVLRAGPIEVPMSELFGS